MKGKIIAAAIFGMILFGGCGYDKPTASKTPQQTASVQNTESDSEKETKERV